MARPADVALALVVVLVVAVCLGVGWALAGH